MINRVDTIDDLIRIQRVLISVADKSGLEDFAKGLVAINPDIIMYSTGGTYKAIESALGKDAEKNLRAVSDYTAQKEMQGGLVKTLDFKIYLGILSEPYNADHDQDRNDAGAELIDMVVVNLYPFQDQVSKEGTTLEDARSHIDIGGPTMLRASAKNFLRVASVTKPQLYSDIITEMKQNKGSLSFQTRLNLSKISFQHSAEYDAGISKYLNTLPADADTAYQKH